MRFIDESNNGADSQDLTPAQSLAQVKASIKDLNVVVRRMKTLGVDVLCSYQRDDIHGTIDVNGGVGGRVLLTNCNIDIRSL